MYIRAGATCASSSATRRGRRPRQPPRTISYKLVNTDASAVKRNLRRAAQNAKP